VTRAVQNCRICFLIFEENDLSPQDWPIFERFFRLTSFLRYTFADRLGIAVSFWAAICLAGAFAHAQVSVLTAHNDIARTGQNLNETILTPSNVNPTQFGKLFSQTASGSIYAQPLYVPQLTIAKAVHNVVYVATTNDQVFAFDADTNGGAKSGLLWTKDLRASVLPAGSALSLSGVWGTPVIDLTTNTMYLVSNETVSGSPIFRFHALDITTGVEKFGGPVQVQASVLGTGSDSSGGILTFDPTYQKQRPGLLLINGVVYVGFGSNNDEGPWHGWIFSYTVNQTSQTLQQIDVFCTSPNGTGDGIWMGGSGLAGEVYSSAKPYGRIFVPTANGTYSVGTPFTRAMSYGMSLMNLDLSGGVITVEDIFTPFNVTLLDSEDGDLGSGGPILLPTQTLASGKTLNPLVQVGKSGMIYILDRDNSADGSNNPATEYSPAGLGGYNSTGDQIVQEVQTPISSGVNWGSGVWGNNAYWNNNIYSGGTNVSTTVNYSGSGSHLTAWSFVNGVLFQCDQPIERDLFLSRSHSVNFRQWQDQRHCVGATDLSSVQSGSGDAVGLRCDKPGKHALFKRY
jgi:hypothetical protein